jgi:hypothetical protein
MAQARVCFEFNGHLFLIGCTRVGVAMRSLNSREVSLLQPFTSIEMARQMCKALSRAQVIAFVDDGAAQVNGLRTRKRHAGRRRRKPRRPATLASMPVRRPSAPLRVSVAATPTVSSRPMPRRAFVENRRPDPATVAELETVINRLETGT